MPGMQSMASVSSDGLKTKQKQQQQKEINQHNKQIIATLINMYNLNMNLY